MDRVPGNQREFEDDAAVVTPRFSRRQGNLAQFKTDPDNCVSNGLLVDCGVMQALQLFLDISSSQMTV